MLRTKTVEFTITSDVANGGTFTVTYPSGYSDGDFENASGHYIVINGSKLKQPADIGLSFGTTSVTVTNRTGGPIVAGTGYMTFFRQGDAAGVVAEATVNGLPALKHVGGAKLVPLLVDFGAPIIGDADGISASQSVAAAANAVIDGVLASTSAAGAAEVTVDAPYGRNVVASWTGTAVLTVTGEDYLGQTMVEVSASGTSLTGKKAFKKITSASFSAAVTAATIGTGDVLGLPVRVPGVSFVIGELQDNVALPKKNSYVQIPFQLTEAEVDAGGSFWVFPGFAGNVVDMGSVVEGTVTTGGTITVEIGGTAVDGLNLVIADGAAAGDVDTATATAGHASIDFTASQALEIVVPSAFNASAPTNGFIGVQPTSPLTGTFVAGLAKDTESTSTGADVRGTYDPNVTLDGTTSLAVLVMVPEPSDIGNPQYTA